MNKIFDKAVIRRFNKLSEKAGLELEQVQALCKRRYFEAPASKGHHLAYPGGLLEHSVNVAEKLVELTKTLKIKWGRPEGPYLVGLLHDLVKCDCYKIVLDGTGPQAPLGEGKEKYIIKWNDKWGDDHGLASLDICDELGIKLNSDERSAIKYHMGRFGIGKEYLECRYRDALDGYGPQVLATHFADWWASEIIESKASVG